MAVGEEKSYLLLVHKSLNKILVMKLLKLFLIIILFPKSIF